MTRFALALALLLSAAPVFAIDCNDPYEVPLLPLEKPCPPDSPVGRTVAEIERKQEAADIRKLMEGPPATPAEPSRRYPGDGYDNEVGKFRLWQSLTGTVTGARAEALARWKSAFSSYTPPSGPFDAVTINSNVNRLGILQETEWALTRDSPRAASAVHLASDENIPCEDDPYRTEPCPGQSASGGTTIRQRLAGLLSSIVKLLAALLALTIMAALLRTIVPPLLGFLKAKREAKPAPAAVAPVHDDPPVSSFIAGADEAIAHGAASPAPPQPPQPEPATRTAKAESAVPPAKPKRASKGKGTPSLHEDIERQFNPSTGAFADRAMRVRVYRLWMDLEHVADEKMMKKAFIMAITNGAFTAEERIDILAALYAGV